MLGLSIDNRPTRAAPHSKASIPPRRRPRLEPYAVAGVEPRIEDILSDPVTWALMERDGVSEASLRSLIDDVRYSLKARTHQCPGGG